MTETRSTDRLILSLCDYSGVWSNPYREAGYKVVQVDIALDGSDVRLLERVGEVHGIIAQPPCTAFAASGARWWRGKGLSALLEGLSIVDACMRIISVEKPKWWVLENPAGRISYYLGSPAHVFQPHWYAGHSADPESNQYKKRTCLWGNFSMPPVTDEGYRQPTRKLPRDPRQRSLTPDGFARAFFEYNP